MSSWGAARNWAGARVRSSETLKYRCCATGISVNARVVSELDLLTQLLAATAEANTPRMLARAVATTLAMKAAVTYVSVGAAMVELRDSEWSPVEARVRSAETLVPGLSVHARSALPAYFSDPAFKSALAAVIDSALRHLEVVQRVARLSRRAHVEARELRSDLDRLTDAPTIVARSAAMRDALARAALVAKHTTTVLITGESGTGKEVLAHEIHRLSPRAHRPMLIVNCGAIPESLIESELFGHERGAFTGADRRHIGVFERAHRGTLFLDEIGELPAAAQVKLLRVIQTGAFHRVGGTDQVATDVRLIAATHRSLPTLVREGTFREDLFYRINVFAIALPPLRDRRDDIAPLVSTLVKQICARLALPVPTISRALLAQLEHHDWPGNVRELANVLESALIVSDGKKLELPTLGIARDRCEASFDHAIAQTIEAALRATRGKIYGSDGAAARLGLKPATLQSKMRKLGIERAAFTR
jgi:formate hydrogenlyase transcriptional activator